MSTKTAVTDQANSSSDSVVIWTVHGTQLEVPVEFLPIRSQTTATTG